MKKIITFIVLLFLTSLMLCADDKVNSINTSTYTSIAQKDCISLDSDNIGSVQECESFTNIGVKVVEGDIRQSIILTRDNKEYNLEFLSTLKLVFSSFGLKIEWRHEVENPKNIKGMIIPLNMSNKAINLDKTSTYLLVSKITNDEICVVAKIAPQNEQNEIAREILDTDENLSCLKK